MLVGTVFWSKASMSYERPIPDPEPRKKHSAVVDAIVQAERLMQIALVLPSSVFIGWFAGAWLDERFHQTWISLAGIVFGCVSGLVYVVRLALAAGNRPEGRNADRAGKGPADKEL